MVFGKKKKPTVEEDYDEGPEIDEITEDPEEEPEEEPVKKRKLVKKPVTSSERYSVFDVASRTGIVDSESKEIIAEGELAVLQMLANMKGQLEKLEKTIGDIIEE